MLISLAYRVVENLAPLDDSTLSRAPIVMYGRGRFFTFSGIEGLDVRIRAVVAGLAGSHTGSHVLGRFVLEYLPQITTTSVKKDLSSLLMSMYG